MTSRPTLRFPVEYSEAPDLKEKCFNPWPGLDKPEYIVLDCCKHISLASRELEFEVVDLGNVGSDLDRVVRELDALGLRPIIYPELMSFIRRYPDEFGMSKLWGNCGLAAAGCYIQRGYRHLLTYTEDVDSGYWGIEWSNVFGYPKPNERYYLHFLATKK